MKRILFALALVGCGGIDDSSGVTPTVEAMNPTAGAQTGGTMVTVTGSGFDFDPATPVRVSVGGGVVDGTVVSNTELTFLTPPGPEGPATVTIFHGGGSVNVAVQFHYAPLPSIAEVFPRRNSSGKMVSVRGSGFLFDNPGTITVSLGGADLENITVVADDLLTGTVGARVDNPLELVDATVTTANGSDTVTDAFSYLAPGFLATNRNNPDLWYYINPENAEISLYGRAAAAVRLVTADVDGRIFGVVEELGETLVEIDPITLSATSIAAEMPNFRFSGDIAVDNGVLFALHSKRAPNAREFRRFDLATGAPISAVVTTTGDNGRCIFRNNAATLFLIEGLDGPLFSLTKATGAISPLLTLDGPVGFSCHAAAELGGDIYILGNQNRTLAGGDRRSHLFRLDIAQGQLTDIGVLEFENLRSQFLRQIVATPPDF